jgi:predicted transcriptional regulator
MMRDKVLSMIQRLPPDVTIEKIMEKLYLLAKVERGLRQIDAGQGVPHEEAKRRLRRER